MEDAGRTPHVMLFHVQQSRTLPLRPLLSTTGLHGFLIPPTRHRTSSLKMVFRPLPNEILILIFKMAAQSTVILCFDTETTPPWGKTSLRLVCRWVNDLVLSVHRLRWDVWIGPPKRMADPIHDWLVIINGGIPRLLKGEESNATLRLRGEETCHIEQTAITKWADIPMHKLLNQYHKFEVEESTDTASRASPGLNLQRFPKLWTYTATYRDAGDATILPQGTSKTSLRSDTTRQPRGLTSIGLSLKRLGERCEYKS